MTDNNDNTITLKDIKAVADAVSRLLRYTWAPLQQQTDDRNFPINLETYWNQTLASLVEDAGIATIRNSPQCFDKEPLLQALRKRIDGDVAYINQPDNPYNKARSIAHVLIMSKAVETAITQGAIPLQTPEDAKSVVTEEWANSVVDACNAMTAGEASVIAELPRRIKLDIPNEPTLMAHPHGARHHGSIDDEAAIVRGYLSGK